MNLFKIFGTIAVNNSEANNAVDETADKASSASSAISGAFKKIGTAVVTYLAADKIKSFGQEIVNCSAEVSAEQSAFAQIMGNYSQQAQEKLKAVADATGMLDTRLTPYMTSMTAKFKGLGYGIDDSTDLAQRGLTLAADAAAFWDKSLKDSMGGLNSFINGSYEGGEAIGLFANDTQMASYAVQQGIIGESKEWANLDEARKQATRLQYAEDMYKMSGATGQAAKESGQYANVQANLTEKWRQFKAQIGEPVLQNIVIPAMSALSGIVDVASQKFEQAQPFIQAFGDKVIAVRDKAVELGNYASETFAPVIDKVRDAFQRGKETVQPFIDVLGDYFTSGEAAADVTDLIKGAIDGAAGVAEGLIGGVTSIAQGFQDMYTWAQQNTGILTTLGVILGGLTTAVLAYNASKVAKKVLDLAETAQIYALIAAETAHTAVTAVATAATTAFGAAVAFLTSPITIVIGIITALIAIGVLLYQNWDTVKAKCQELGQRLSEIWSAITTAISGAIENIRAVISEKFEAAKQIVINIFTAISTAISTAWETIKNIVQVGIMFVVELITAAFQLITLPWRLIWENCKEYIMAAWETIKTIISNALKAIETTISNVWNAIVAFLNPLLERLKSIFTDIWNAIMTTISTVVTTIQNVITTVWNEISNVVTSILNAISSTVSDIWNSIQSTVSSVVNAILSVISDVFSTISSTISSILESIKSTFTSIWDSIKSTVSDVIDGIKSTISDGINAAKDTVSGVLDSIKDKFSSIFKSAKSIVSDGIETIKSFFDFSWSLPDLKLPHFSVSGSFSLNPPSVPHFGIEWYKKAMDNPMVLDEATIFGYNPSTGKALGGGEAGQEIISGADTLRSMIREAVAAEKNGNEDKVVELLQTLLNWLSNGGLRDVMIEVLTKHVKLKWENRELARLVRTYA